MDGGQATDELQMSFYMNLNLFFCPNVWNITSTWKINLQEAQKFRLWYFEWRTCKNCTDVTHRCTAGVQQFLDPDRWTAKMATQRPIDCVCLAIDWPRSGGAHHSLRCSNVSSSPIHLHLSTALLGLISSTAPLVYIVVNPFITLHVS